MAEKRGLALNSPVLVCTLTVEQLMTQGMVQKTTIYKNAKILLGRNQFRDIILQIETSKVSLKFILTNFQLHKRFMTDGKATLFLKNQMTKLMISNAPPTSLLQFLKILSSKHEKNSQDENVMPIRNRMLSLLSTTFEEISPLTVKEYESVRQLKGKLPHIKRNPNIGLSGSSPVSSKHKIKRIKKDFADEEQATKVPRVSNPVILSEDQKKVLLAVQNGYSIFFTGSAGTGKSFLLKMIVGALPPDVTYVTASTGIAACHIGGTTLHSFAGIGSGSAPIEECIKLAQRNPFLYQWKNCKHLIIDEISMVDGIYFKKMEMVARHIRASDKPFGGIQLIACGDFLQLPPVVKRGEKRSFCFQVSAWDRCIKANFQLAQVRRQDDPVFINILQNLRMGRCTPEDEKVLKDTIHNCVEKDGIKATRLCTHKDDVDHINSHHLSKLPGEGKIFMSLDSDPYLSDTLDSQTPVLGKLKLKVGAQVMLMKNLDVSRGLVNGARGVIESFTGTLGLPLVKFACGITREIKPEKWVAKARGGLVINRRQIPLKLAWAFSIHKSQGMTLDCVEMSLAKVFEVGQGYVALSRARNLKSLRLLDFSSSSIKAHPEVQQFYQNLRNT